MKNFIISSFLILLSLTSKSQCFEIESILVDACTPGSLTCSNVAVATCNCEGKNEMVRFKVGAVPLSVSSLTINWPNNSYLGISPVTATTTGIVNALNSTIVGCGWLKEPVGGVLRANNRVLLITSTDFCSAGNSFANLNDTLTVIFQNSGNYQGHFVNYSSVPGLRTLSMTFTTVPGCTDAVTYDKSLLVNQSGGYGGSSAANDGSTVEFDPAGTASYVNHGCQAPFVPLTVDAGVNKDLCIGNSALFTATVTGGVYNTVLWSGGAGTFSSPSALTTSYTPTAGESGTTIKLYVSVTNNCPPKSVTTKDSVYITNLQIPSTPSISASNGFSLCPLASTILSYSISNATATGTMSTSWSLPAASTSTYAIAAPAGTVPVTYTLNLTDFCGVTTKTVNVYPLASPSVTISAPTLTACAGNTVAVMATSNSGNFSWNNPSGATTASVALTANTTTTGIVTTTNTCGTKTDSYTLTVTPQPTVSISPTAISLCSGQSAMVTASANTAVTYTWSGTGITGLNTNTVSLNTAGNYTVTASNVCNTSTAQVNVIVNSTPSLSVASTSTLLCGGTTATLSLAGSVGTFSWSTGAITPTIAVALGGTYTATVTTASCGFTTSSIALSALPTPTISVTNTLVTICTGQTATLTANSNINNYLWNTSATTNTISVNTAGIYTVGVFNACGIATETINVTLSATPTLSVNSTSTVLCSGATATLSLTGSVGTYSWSNGDTSPTTTVTLGGAYTATVTTASCGFTTSSISLSALPTPTISVTNTAVTICTGQTATLTANSNINNYLWNTSATTNTISVNTAGTYTVGISNACGSASTAVVVVSSATPTLSINTPSLNLCSGVTETLTLSGSAGTYSWNTGSTSSSLPINISGTYIATVTTASCGSATSSVVIASLPSVSLTVTSNTAIVCNGVPIVLSATSTGTNYSWLPLVASTNTLQVITAGVYSVTTSNSCGSALQTVTVTSGTTPALIVTPIATVVCPGNTTSIAVTGGAGVYNWSGTSSTSSIVTVFAGNYTVSNTNACGTGSQTIIVNTSTVIAGLNGTPLTGTQPLTVSFNNLSVGATTYTWNYGNGITTNGFTPVSQTYTTAGTYIVLLSVTNANGCADSQSIFIVVNNEPAVLVIPNVFTPNNDSINDVFKVAATNIIDFYCIIFDRWGLQLYSWSDVKGGWDGKTGGKDATDGTYFYMINATDIDGKTIEKQGSFQLIH